MVSCDDLFTLFQDARVHVHLLCSLSQAPVVHECADSPHSSVTVISVQQTSQKEESQVQVLSYTQEVQEEITDSEVSFNTPPRRSGITVKL